MKLFQIVSGNVIFIWEVHWIFWKVTPMRSLEFVFIPKDTLCALGVWTTRWKLGIRLLEKWSIHLLGTRNLWCVWLRPALESQSLAHPTNRSRRGRLTQRRASVSLSVLWTFWDCNLFSCCWDTVTMDEQVWSMVLTLTEDQIAVGLRGFKTQVMEVESLQITRHYDGYRPTLSGDNNMIFTHSKSNDINCFDVLYSSFLHQMKSIVVLYWVCRWNVNQNDQVWRHHRKHGHFEGWFHDYYGILWRRDHIMECRGSHPLANVYWPFQYYLWHVPDPRRHLPHFYIVRQNDPLLEYAICGLFSYYWRRRFTILWCHQSYYHSDVHRIRKHDQRMV